jgi:chemotaxis protein methyltransferase CheR
VRDDDCVRFLQWALPKLRMRWPGFRKVRRQVCRRITRRIAALDLDGLDDYRRRLADDPDEWRVLDRLCRVTISRFWRDRGTFTALEEVVLPELADRLTATGGERLDVWSCGCASGEEPYSLAILWAERLQPRFPTLDLRIFATDLDIHLLQRARRGVYPRGSVKELPADLAAAALEPRGGDLRITDRLRGPVSLALGDVRDGTPAGPFHLILCRNLVFTYFDEELQLEVGGRLIDALCPYGALVVGGHEMVPADLERVETWTGAANVFRRI